MKHTAHDFWRDRANFSWLSLLGRIPYKKAIALVTSLGGLGAAIYRLVVMMTNDPVLIGGIVATLAYPCYLVAELYMKGGEAGAKMMDEVSRLSDSEGAKSNAKRVAKIFDQMSFNVKDILASFKDRPGEGTLDEPLEAKTFDRQIRDSLMAYVASCNDELRKADCDEVFGFHIEPDADPKTIHALASKLLVKVDAARTRHMTFSRN